MSKRTLWILAGVVALIAAVLIIRGGWSKENAAFAAYKNNAPEGTLAAIVNNPDTAVSSKAVKIYVADKNGEMLLVIPRYTGSSVSVEPVRLEGEDLVALPAVFMAPKVPDNWTLLLTAMRPEGMPMWRVTVSGPKGSGSYVISYNGKTGTPAVEYITKQ